MTDYDNVLKILFIGKESSNKTSLINNYISGLYNEDLRLTIGVDFYSKIVNFKVSTD
jgi:GTPase SAR1 family protein